MVTNATNERTIVASIIPFCGSVNSINNIFPKNARDACLILSNLNSFVCDYVARQKVGAQALNQWSLKQLPIVPKNAFEKFKDDIVNNVLKLTYTSTSLRSFANELGYNDHPFNWDPKDREHLRAELDAIVAHLYGVTRDELDYILETFPIVKRKDEAKYGEYRTKRLILEYYDKYEGKIAADATEELEVKP